MPSWFDLLEIPVEPTSPEVEDDFQRAVARAHELVRAQVAAGVPPGRIVLGGFSQGGALALASALQFDAPLAGAVCFSGWVVGRDTLARRVKVCVRMPAGGRALALTHVTHVAR